MINYAAEGIKRMVPAPHADIQTIWHKEPDTLLAVALLGAKMGYPPKWIEVFLDCLVCPDWIVSGYRDLPVGSQVKNSAHMFCLAVDIKTSNDKGRNGLESQISWVNEAIKSNLFYRAGLYPGANVCHVDRCDKIWMNKYKAMPYWVMAQNKYTSFWNLDEAIEYAYSKL